MASAGIFTIDLEEYFHAEAFSDSIDRSSWDSRPRRVVSNTLKLLDLLDAAGTTATFFALGWVAEREAGLMREIVARGHEIACHSYWHRLVFGLRPSEFRSDTLLAKDVIEQACGCPVYGYRAPSFSITQRSSWAHEILAELGFTYDSSIFPVHHDIYGWPEAPRVPFSVSDTLLVVPMTTFSLMQLNCPVGGGGYLRLMPWWMTRAGIARAEAQGVHVVSYVHPWEIDTGQPHLPARLRSRIRHYTNLTSTFDKLRNLLAFRRFSCFRDSCILAGRTDVVPVSATLAGGVS